MTTINDRIFDRIVEHMSDVRLYEEGQQILQRRIMRRHRERLTKLLQKDIRADVKPEVTRFGKELNSSVINSVKEFSTSQLDFHTDNVYKEVNKFYKMKKPRTRELISEITGPGMRGEKSLTGNIKNISSGELVRIQSKVKAGLANSKSPKDIIADVMRTTKMTEHQASTITRTAITSTQTAALDKVMQDNKEIIKGYMFTAILDSRTSPICQHHNGKIYDVNDKRFMPPLHWRCRSSLVPVLKSKSELQETESQRLNKSKVDKLDPAKVSGVAPKRESFGEWLKRQGMAVQTKMLGGEEQANLFRRGQLKVEQFVTPKGNVLSIQALRNRAAKITSIFKPRQKVKDTKLTVQAKNPNSLLNNPKHQDDLLQVFLSDADDFNSPMALTDYKGTSLVGKQTSRRRSANQFDERNFTADPFTGEVKSNLVYEPDFNLFQERLDFMRNAKDLTREQKDFIAGFVAKLDDRISVNQQTTVVENLRVTFQRFNKEKTPWEDFAAVIRAEHRFAVQNTSRLLDVRSRRRAEIFGGFQSKEGVPQVQIMGKYYKVDELIDNQLADSRFVADWEKKAGAALARRMYVTGKAPFNSYTQALAKKYPTKKKVIKNIWNQFPFIARAVVDIRIKEARRIGNFKEVKKLIKRRVELTKATRKGSRFWDSLYDFLFKEKLPQDAFFTRMLRKVDETRRSILDAELKLSFSLPKVQVMDEKVEKALSKAIKTVANGRATDYDSLAINIGKNFYEDIKDINPFTKHTLQDYHTEGAKILEYMRQRKLIQVSFRGKTRRGVWDVETGRSSGGWGDTIAREVKVIDKELLKLQEANNRLIMARRFGTINDRDRLYVKAGYKEFFDARGNKTNIPIISADKYPDYDPRQIDAEMAQMMNHVMNVEYRVDDDYFDFMDDIARFRDPRGNVQKYDELNAFRKSIIERGEAGYGLMSSGRFHRQRGKAFRTDMFIDSRGRVYHRGYLTPTGGELVRPFLNSGKAISMTTEAVDELRIQVGALIGPGTEALTQAGRREIFKRNEDKILSLGRLMLAKTQRDRRLREFLEHPLIQGHEGPEVAKLARLALEYARVHDHVKGDFKNISLLRSYKTRLMIENDASSSGAQIIGLSTGDRKIAEVSNVVATTKKNRLYDLIAMDTINDPEYNKIPALRNADLTWEELSKGAKYQNMVTFYGAGEATKTANVANPIAKILNKKGYTAITKDNLNEITRIVDGKIKLADKLGADATKEQLQNFRKELIDVVNGNTPVGRKLMTEAMDIHPDVDDFVRKLHNTRKGLIGPKDFEEVSRIMSKHLAARAPVTEEFIEFWKIAAKKYVADTGKVDIPWVTFDGKTMMQRYRGKNQTRIEFTDPVTGRKIANIYEGTVDDGLLRGKHAYADASIGLGVNGNHSNDAVIVRRFHLWARKNGVDSGTIHDAFFTNIGEAQRAKNALRTIYADALEGDTIRKTLDAMRKNGLSKSTYNALLAEAKRRGLIDPPNKLTRKDILAPIQDDYDWYGIGP